MKRSAFIPCLTVRLTIGLFSIVLFAGCGDGRTDVYPVTGKVTYQGNAVPIGLVMFYPENGGRPAVGEIGPDGTYRLRTYTDQFGALPGKNIVTITARTEAPPGQEAAPPEERVAPIEGEILGRAAQATVRWIVPEEYSQRNSTPLSAEVVAKENTIDFALPVDSRR